MTRIKIVKKNEIYPFVGSFRSAELTTKTAAIPFCEADANVVADTAPGGAPDATLRRMITMILRD